MKTPKYLTIKNDLKSQILNGTYSSGDKFYSQAELVKMYDASSITVIRAVQELVKEGYLVRYQGKGTFVSRKHVNKLVRFTDKEIFSSDEDQVKVLSLTKENDPNILKELNLSTYEHYYKIVRLRTADGIPYIYHQSYIPERFIRRPKDPDYYSSIYQRFRSDFSINLNDMPSKEINKICFPTNEFVANMLQLKGEQPTVFQEKKIRLSVKNTVAEYVITYKRWDYYQIEIAND
ncbi:transcriptional regulator [Ligilactobacillus acidipiscis DSM 15836]|uniref:Transcriptional regulator n=1 Tax=Ligilactobacillus acidipiscis DSM 15836 TaxID=1423716 RepID=A0ABR5PKN8_9LACO|nr:GntR family transcriptional regulator [Ligilactobacillus acidipiscis]KRM29377.1 transcriptional regulator [Ligilactobacillus acidipiscis DSM 15836]GAW64874.1 GntR family transcriptional regulator [Ligilactobacillus acidipiscis]GEN20916.1 GntR family transcriptional regulator [Ligilactobacillus acidipiscis]